MQTTIKQISPVEYELEITAKAEDLAPAFQKALREQQGRTTLKGFRPGKVPLSLVKKMYGKALALTLADQSIQKTYESVVLDDEEHDVLGQPTLTRLDYEMDGDLHAVVQFGVRPEFTLKDFSGEEVTKLVHEVTDEEVEEEIRQLRQERADLVPVEDEPAGPEDLVVFDLQEVDASTGTPLIGKRDENKSLFLDDPRLEESLLLRSLAQALRGARAGATVRFHFGHDKAHGGLTGEHVHHFAATLKEVKRRDVPELDDDFVREVTGGQVEDVASFRAEIRKQMEDVWERRTREFLESNLMMQMLHLHPFPVPSSVVEMYLDSFVEDVKQRNEGKLPEGFSVEDFKEQNREEAEQQARWMLIRDKLIEEEGIDVAEEDLDAFFEQEAGSDGRITAADLRRFYESLPRLMDQLEERLLSRKVFGLLAGRFRLVEKDRATLEREIEERRAKARAEEVAVAETSAASEAE